MILTAVKVKQESVMDYINRLDHYEGEEVAKICADDEYQLYDEALAIYKKFDMPVDAIKILLHKQKNIKGAQEFADKTNQSDVYSELGRA